MVLLALQLGAFLLGSLGILKFGFEPFEYAGDVAEFVPGSVARNRMAVILGRDMLDTVGQG